jgi:O-antigen/teichoic acid export membrane protein
MNMPDFEDASPPHFQPDGTPSNEPVGIFAALAYIQQAGSMVVAALGRSASARLSQHYASGESLEFRKLLIKMVGISALIGGAGVLAALIARQQILTLVYGPEYALESLLLWLMVAAAIDYVATTLHFGMSAARYFRVQLPLFCAATGVAALACLWLVPLCGLSGAAIAIALSNVGRAIGSLWIVFHAFTRIQIR